MTATAGVWILGLSGRTPDALRRERERLAAHLDRPEPPPLADVATTLALGREPFDHRLAVVGRDPAGLRAALRGEPTGPATVVCTSGQPTAADGLDPETARAVEVAAQWCAGADVDLTLGRPGRRIHLPGHVLARGAAPGPGFAGSADYAQTLPLTPLQQRLLFHDIVRLSSTAEHHVAAAVTVDVLDGPLLDEAILAAQRDDPRLRTLFRREGDSWRACVAVEPLVRLAVEPAPPGAADADALVRDVLARPFALLDAVPLRALVLSAPETGHLVVLSAHRAIVDRVALAAALDKAVLRYADAVAARSGRAAVAVRRHAPQGMAT